MRTVTVHGDCPNFRGGDDVALKKELYRRENGTVPFGRGRYLLTALVLSWAVGTSGGNLRAETRAWEGAFTIPTYPWEEDVNPKFWAMEGGPKLSTTVQGSIVYPYTMQDHFSWTKDHLSRMKVNRFYKHIFLENEYLKVTCLPELGGRIHSVLDKTENKEMFYLNHVIKPGMIAMRGAWISGGIEWNSGPQGHTVTAVSPVDALTGATRTARSGSKSTTWRRSSVPAGRSA